eukprot:6889459-Prymnesium_polylepis.1
MPQKSRASANMRASTALALGAPRDPPTRTHCDLIAQLCQDAIHRSTRCVPSLARQAPIEVGEGWPCSLEPTAERQAPLAPLCRRLCS